MWQDKVKGGMKNQDTNAKICVASRGNVHGPANHVSIFSFHLQLPDVPGKGKSGTAKLRHYHQTYIYPLQLLYSGDHDSGCHLGHMIQAGRQSRREVLGELYEDSGWDLWCDFVLEHIKGSVCCGFGVRGHEWRELVTMEVVRSEMLKRPLALEWSKAVEEDAIRILRSGVRYVMKDQASKALIVNRVAYEGWTEGEGVLLVIGTVVCSCFEIGRRD